VAELADALGSGPSPSNGGCRFNSCLRQSRSSASTPTHSTGHLRAWWRTSSDRATADSSGRPISRVSRGSIARSRSWQAVADASRNLAQPTGRPAKGRSEGQVTKDSQSVGFDANVSRSSRLQLFPRRLFLLSRRFCIFSLRLWAALWAQVERDPAARRCERLERLRSRDWTRWGTI
jgi:hypothetical protein